MNTTSLKNSLQKSHIAFFEVNGENNIKWQNNSFHDLFSFLDDSNSNKKLSFKSNKKESFLKLKINKKVIFYKSDLLLKTGEKSIYKINDNHIKKIMVLRDGMECLKNGQINFALQKQFKLDDLSMSGFELLARMHLKNGVQISNEEFMPLIDSAYQLNVIIPKALKKVSSIRDSIVGNKIWINISAELLEANSFCKEFIKLVNYYNLAHNNIGIEITESHTIISNKNIIASLTNLKKHNFNIAMDDFGSGYANIRRLSILPVDVVKLDKSFVFDLDKNNKTKSLIRGIVKIGQDIGFKVLAEGIETKKNLITLKKLGVGYGQGWFIGKPELLK